MLEIAIDVICVMHDVNIKLWIYWKIPDTAKYVLMKRALHYI